MSDYEYASEEERVAHLETMLREANQCAEMWRQECVRYIQECSDAHTALDAQRATAREMVEALEKAVKAATWAFQRMDRGDGVLEYTGINAEGDEAVAYVAEASALLARPEVQRWAGR